MPAKIGLNVEVEKLERLSRTKRPDEMIRIAFNEASYEKEAKEIAPKYSWTAKHALAMALLSCDHSESSAEMAYALFEIGKVVPFLKPAELIGIYSVLENGRDAVADLKESGLKR